MTNNYIYSLNNVTYTFKQRNEQSFNLFSKKKQKEVKLKDGFTLGPLNINIPRGRFTSILGRSGSGKTTLLSILGLLRKEDRGDISIYLNNQSIDTNNLWEGKDTNELFRAQNIGFALQKGELLPYLSLFENAMLTAQFLNKDTTKSKEKLNTFFEKLYESEFQLNQLENIKSSKPSNVSQGQYQRGAIVRALANDPPIILADEPTGNLDEHTGRQAMAIFKQIVEEYKQSETPKSVIVVTHDLLLAIQFADEIIVLGNGQQVAHFSKKENDEWIELSSKNTISNEEIKDKILEKLE